MFPPNQWKRCKDRTHTRGNQTSPGQKDNKVRVVVSAGPKNLQQFILSVRAVSITSSRQPCKQIEATRLLVLLLLGPVPRTAVHIISHTHPPLNPEHNNDASPPPPSPTAQTAPILQDARRRRQDARRRRLLHLPLLLAVALTATTSHYHCLLLPLLVRCCSSSSTSGLRLPLL